MATKSAISDIIENDGARVEVITSSPVSLENTGICFATPGMLEKEITSPRGTPGFLPITFCSLAVELDGEDACRSRSRVLSVRGADGGFGLESVSLPRSVTNKLCHQWNRVSFVAIVVERTMTRRRIFWSSRRIARILLSMAKEIKKHNWERTKNVELTAWDDVAQRGNNRQYKWASIPSSPLTLLTLFVMGEWYHTPREYLMPAWFCTQGGPLVPLFVTLKVNRPAAAPNNMDGIQWSAMPIFHCRRSNMRYNFRLYCSKPFHDTATVRKAR